MLAKCACVCVGAPTKILDIFKDKKHQIYISPLHTKLISLMVLCRLVPPSFTCISTSARS